MSAIYRITGSNQTEVDESMRETLAGRISYFYLHGLSVHEILQFNSQTPLQEILFKGGFPELWVRPELDVVSYLNSYYSTFIHLARKASSFRARM